MEPLKPVRTSSRPAEFDLRPAASFTASDRAPSALSVNSNSALISRTLDSRRISSSQEPIRIQSDRPSLDFSTDTHQSSDFSYPPSIDFSTPSASRRLFPDLTALPRTPTTGQTEEVLISATPGRSDAGESPLATSPVEHGWRQSIFGVVGPGSQWWAGKRGLAGRSRESIAAPRFVKVEEDKDVSVGKRDTLIIRMPSTTSSSSPGRRSLRRSTSSRATLEIRVAKSQRGRRHSKLASTLDANHSDTEVDHPLERTTSRRRRHSLPPPLPTSSAAFPFPLPPPPLVEDPPRASFQSYRGGPSRFSSISLPAGSRFAHLTRKAARTFTSSNRDSASDEASWPRVTLVAEESGIPLKTWEMHPGANAFYFDGRCMSSLPEPTRLPWMKEVGTDAVGRFRIPFALILTLSLNVSFGITFSATHSSYLVNDYGKGGVICAVLFSYSWVISVFSMFWTAFVDPGILPAGLDSNPPAVIKWRRKDGTLVDKASKVDGESLEKVNLVEPRFVRVGPQVDPISVQSKWCSTCEIYRPP